MQFYSFLNFLGFSHLKHFVDRLEIEIEYFVMHKIKYLF